MTTKGIGLLAGVVLAASAANATAGQSSRLVVPLSPVEGSGGGIEGTARFRSKGWDATFRVEVKGAESGTPLTLEVDGEAVAPAQISDDRGNAHFFFQHRGLSEGNGRGGRSGAFAFDPRGKEIVVSGANGALLSGTFGPDDDADTQIHETVNFNPPAGGGTQTGRMHFSQKNGVHSFEVDVEGVEDGELTVFVDGIEQGSIEASGGRGSVRFSDDGSSQVEPLDFEPYGETIEVRQGLDVILTGTLLDDVGIEDANGVGGAVGTP